jgi:hypothetical protein
MVKVTAAAIANGASQSSEIVLGDEKVENVTIEMPAAWTAAAITLLVSFDGVTFSPLHDQAGTEVSFTVAASRVQCIACALYPHLLGVHSFKLRSGTAGVPVNQGAARTFNVRVTSQLL